MSKVIVKQKKCKDNILSDISDLYKNIFDNSKMDKRVILEKLIKIKILLTEFKNNLVLFNELLIKYHIFIDINITHFIQLLNDVLGMPNNAELYDELIKSDVYLKVIQTCALIKNVYENIDSIKNDEDQDIKLFAFSTFSIKLIFNLDNNYTISVTVIENEFLDALKNMYLNVHNISEEIFKPDIDIDSVCILINRSLDLLKTKVQRCDNAFNIIRNSLDIFRGNFNKYYKEAKISGNDNGIILNFFSDLSDSENLKKYKNSATISREFKTIITYIYQTKAKAFKNQPQINNLLNSAIRYL